MNPAPPVTRHKLIEAILLEIRNSKSEIEKKDETEENRGNRESRKQTPPYSLFSLLAPVRLFFDLAPHGSLFFGFRISNFELRILHQAFQILALLALQLAVAFRVSSTRDA